MNPSRFMHQPQKRVARQGLLCAAASVAVLGLCFRTTLAAPAPVESPDQLQAMFDQAQYKDLLVPLGKSLLDKASLADPKTHYALLMLKGETMLRTKASGAAQDAFRAASLVTGADGNSVAIAKATYLLVKKSSGTGKYQPKTKSDTTSKTAVDPAIDIVLPDSRKQAFAAFFTDLYEPAKPVVAAAEKATSLQPIMDVTPQLGDLRAVEIAATGADAQSKDLMGKLATRASELLSASLKPMTTEIATITKSASKTMRGSVARTVGNGQTAVQSVSMTTGLSPQNVESLDNIVTQAREISAAAATLQTTFGDAGDFKTIKSDADKDVEEANKLLAKYKKPTE